MTCEGNKDESKDMTHFHRLVLILAMVASLPPSQALAQGETTSAIVGQVRDTTKRGRAGRHSGDHQP